MQIRLTSTIVMILPRLKAPTECSHAAGVPAPHAKQMPPEAPESAVADPRTHTHDAPMGHAHTQRTYGLTPSWHYETMKQAEPAGAPAILDDPV